MPPLSDQTHFYSGRALQHVQYFCEAIGPRPSTGVGERLAAEYAAGVMRQLELQDVRLESFRSGRSTYRPFLLAFLAGLAGNVIGARFSSRSSTALAMLLNGAAAWGFAREAELRSNWMRRVLPQGESQNAISIVPAREEVLRRVVIYGHLDSHRTPVFYASPSWLRAFSFLVSLGFTGLVAGTGVPAFRALRKVAQDTPLWLRWVGGGSTLVQLIAIALTLQADTTPYTCGANDNASGAATALALAERLMQEPLQHTEVWVVNNGCEEVGAYGIAALLDAHGSTLRDAYFLDFDMVGIGRPALLTREGMLRPTFPDEELLNLAREVAARNPDLLAPEHPGGAYTDTGMVTQKGFRGLTIDSQIPSAHPAYARMGYWHQTADTADKIERDCLARTHEFAWQLLQNIDGLDG
ncbi:MAG TPA: M20/M25/M40 family metallo-hydrolase [Abditibacteriaceae bacterium]|nr:M20/M25/M40 family metallo-hydrolase [Abditibacteriaceae bacterium]